MSFSCPSSASTPKTSLSIASQSTATLGRSQLQSSNNNDTTTTSTVTTTSTTASHQLEAFIEQDLFDDGTLHGRVPDHVVHFDEDSCIPFYEARAETAIAQFDAAFAGGDNKEC
ncbi:hypothetical protein QBC40DRAFT_248985 [Triangularia verruculosa]|uniref:Uncharacterized protein n=1 Tax=Triangularia verruculosa TaxID=2587418 RepID=A0AAN6XRU1_9PEZI|nr:hypothetical protein QBC40DRAFT_248985 [Triangularia verruculosa]